MHLNRVSNYDKEPIVKIKGFEQEAWQGYEAVINEIKSKLSKLDNEKRIIVIEAYPGVRKEELRTAFSALNPILMIDADDAMISDEAVFAKIERTLTDDRVFGVMSHFTIDEFIDEEKMEKARTTIDDQTTGNVLVYGVGASRVVEPDILVYADLARWEIQLRFRSGDIANWKATNHGEDPLRMYKRGFFFEWRMADRLKRELFDKIDYLLDTNLKNDPKMITGNAFVSGLKQTVSQPFRVVPYFDPGVWGGQWMKEVCDLDREAENYAWSFDGVPEENSLYLQYGDVRVEIPAIDVVFYEPKKLLGQRVYSRFGAEFPIRFNFLDTIGGGNLSLQVHPTTDYAYDKFGMQYTQEESYYILDAENHATVYLGLKDNVDKDAMFADLEKANAGEFSFPDEKYINQLAVKKHDHVLIPPGTIHSSASGCMVLEISSTKNLFTFKLWDWDRVGLDGKPRPVHLEHGSKVIDWEMNPEFVDNELVNQFQTVSDQDGWIIEKTGLHEREFIETHRHWISDKAELHTKGSVNVLNLVDGEEAIVESPTGAFEPYTVHYAETFIIPEQVGAYTIRPYGASIGKKVTVMHAWVR